MPHLTDEEYDALDEEMTKADLKLTDIPGPFARQDILLETLDIVARNYIITIAETTHKTPSQVIGDMVREKIVAAAESLADAVGEASVAKV
jgi:hypothetical protein